MRLILSIIISCLISVTCISQNTVISKTTGYSTDGSAILDVYSTTQGILIPRMSSEEREVIPSPANGLLIYNITTNKFNYYKSAGTAGWYELSRTFLSSDKGTNSPGAGVEIHEPGVTPSTNSASILDVYSTMRGLLIPRTTESSLSLVTGLIYYDNSLDKLRYYDGSSWKTICETFINANTGGAGVLTTLGALINDDGSAANPSAMLDLNSNTKGLLIPRMTVVQRGQILPVAGLMIYNTETNTIDYFNGTNWDKLEPDVPPQPSVITGNASPCRTEAGLSYSVTGMSDVTYSWTIPSGWSYTSGYGTNSITVTSSITSGDVAVALGNACGNGLQRTLSVTLLPDFTDGSILSAGETICYNGNPSVIGSSVPASGGDDNITYQWQSSEDVGFSTPADIAGSNAETYDPPAGLTASTWYRRQAKDGTCYTGWNTSTGVWAVTVNPTLSQGSIGSAQTICYNTTPAQLIFTASPSGGNGSYSYLWYMNGVSTGITATAYTPPALTATSTFFCAVTSCGETKSTATITITVNPTLSQGVIGNAQTICYGASPSQLSFTSSPTGGNGGYSYLWYKDGGSTGITTNTYSPPTLTTNTTIFCYVTSCGETKNTSSITITVKPALSQGVIGDAQTICYNTAPTQLGFTSGPTGGDNSYSYLWYKNSISTDITTSTYSPGALTPTSTIYCAVTSCGETKNTSTITITVKPTLSQGAIGNEQTICYNTAPTQLSFTSGPTGGDNSYTYLWYKNSISTGITTNTYSPGVLTSTSTFYCAVTSCGETKNTSTITITVNPTLSQGAIGNAQTICYNTAPTQLSFTSGPSGGNSSYTYLWYKNSSSTGITTSTYAPGALTSTSTFYCAVTSCGEIKNTASITITVNPTLSQGAIGNAQTICYNTAPTQLGFTSGPSGGNSSYTYLWYKNSSSTGITTSTYAPGALTSTSTIYCAVTSCGETKNTSTISITVNPTSVGGTATATASTLCSGSTTTVTVSGYTGTIQWQQSATGTSGWANVTGGIGSTTPAYTTPALTSTTYYRAVVTSGICPSANSTTASITILTVGDMYLGGRIYSCPVGGAAGMLVSVTSASTYQYATSVGNNCSGTYGLSCPCAVSTTDGTANTLALNNGKPSTAPAGAYCYNLTTGPVSAGTWRLPSSTEFSTLYTTYNGTTLDKLSTTTTYWTSTGYSNVTGCIVASCASNIYALTYFGGASTCTNKTTSCQLRCIRNFP